MEPLPRTGPPAHTLPKILGFVGIYCVLHFLHDWFPGPLARVIAATDESIFQHVKIGYWAWTFASAAEAAFPSRRAGEGFLASRALGALLVPWFILILWYMAPAFVGPIPHPGLEVAWAFLVLGVASAATASLERSLGATPVSPLALAMILSFWFIALVFFVRFSFGLPWVDLFQPLN